MQVGQPGPSQSHSREWRDVRRDRFADVWQQLSQLTVLAAAPGWGRTTWMAQCRDSMSAAESLWVSDRASFNAALSRLGERGVTLFVDDVLLGSSDPGWEQLLDTLERAPEARAVVTSIDDPPATAAQRVSTTVVHEADLAFTPDEISALAALNAPGASIELIGSATTRLRGHPLTTRTQLERARSQEHLVWASPDVPLERQVVGVLDSALAGDSDSIELARTFRHAVTLRRFSARLLAVAAGLPMSTATAAFERLRHYPLGSVGTDDESGDEVVEWSEPAWAELRSRYRDENARHHRCALDAVSRAGLITGQLYYLLELGEHAEAERLVSEHLRLFLLIVDDLTQRRLLGLTAVDLSDAPNLALLAGEVLLRRGAHAGVARPYFRSALTALTLAPGQSAFARFRVLARQAFAAAALGDREQARAFLDACSELAQDSSGHGLRATINASTAARVAAECYLPFWVSTQLDDHARALDFAALMRAFHNPTSGSAVAESLTALTEEVFLGVKNNDGGEAGGLGHTDPLSMLETGADDDAAHLIGLLAPRVDHGPSRSALDALVMLVQALTNPRELSEERVERLVQRSADWWTDGKSSTFIVLAAVVAHLKAERVSQAQALLARRKEEDWFVTVARALLRLERSQNREALADLTAARAMCPFPRPYAVASALVAVAHLRLGWIPNAISDLEELRRSTSEPLFRFALRATSPSDLRGFLADTSAISAQLQAQLIDTRDDDRWLPDRHRIRLTRAERELVKLLVTGHSNTSIAEQRYVSINTVRTQLRTLYRKLGVNGRGDVVARARTMGLLEG